MPSKQVKTQQDQKQAASYLLARAPSRAPHLGPALPQAPPPPGALFGVRGFGTFVADQATREEWLSELCLK